MEQQLICSNHGDEVGDVVSGENNDNNAGESLEQPLICSNHHDDVSDDNNDKDDNNGASDENNKQSIMSTIKKWNKSLENNDHFIFAIRICLCAFVASLFTLLSAPPGSDSGYTYPHGVWVYITGMVVLFFPTLDMASSMKKSFHRLCGTVVGAAIGLAVGFLSSLIGYGSRGQAAFIGIMIVLQSFAIPYYFHHKKYTPYGLVLGLITTGMTSLAFYTFEPKPWSIALWRSVNIMIGCLIAGIFPFFIFPRSIETVLDTSINKTMTHMSKSIQLLLEMVESKQDGSKLSPVWQMTMNGVDDEVHEAYAMAHRTVTSARSMLPLAKYDPFLRLKYRSTEQILHHQKVTQTQLLRLGRLSYSIVMLDSLIRHGIQNIDNFTINTIEGEDDEESQRKQMAVLLSNISQRLQTILDKDESVEKRNEAANLLLSEDVLVIQKTRSCIVISTTSNFAKDIDLEALSNLHEFYSKEDLANQFLYCVENIILRAVRLHLTLTRDIVVAEDSFDECEEQNVTPEQMINEE